MLHEPLLEAKPSLPYYGHGGASVVLVQGQRNGFIDQYIYSEDQLETMKLRQQQKEANMKPWEREIENLEKYFLRSQEEHNILKNTKPQELNEQANEKQTLLEQKQSQKRQIISQYFNYGFTEETFKTYAGQQLQKFYD